MRVTGIGEMHCKYETRFYLQVSPPRGTRGVRVTRSVLREPITVMILGDMISGLFW